MLHQPRPARHGALAAIRGLSIVIVVPLVAVLALGAWFIAVAADLSPAGALPFFLVAPLVAGIRFGASAGAVSGVVVAVVASPLTGMASVGADWLGTGLVMVLIGGLVGLLASAYAQERAREDQIEERERELSGQRVALVQMVSHELRTPLTVIRGTMETLRSREGVVAPGFEDLLDAAQRSSSRLEEMMAVMLAAADDLHDSQSQRAGVAVRDLVHHAALSIDPELPRRLALHVDTEAIVLTVEPYLWLALRCLLDNAAKFAPPDSPIEVVFGHEGSYVVLTVRDHGRGFPDEFELLAFEPFTQADSSLKRPHPGLGMGLYTARRLARRLGGDVELESTPQGVTARIVLPHADRSARRPVPVAH